MGSRDKGVNEELSEGGRDVSKRREARKYR